MSIVTPQTIRATSVATAAGKRARAAGKLDEAERELTEALVAAIEAGDRVNIAAVANVSGVSRQTLYSRLSRAGIADVYTGGDAPPPAPHDDDQGEEVNA